MDTLKAITTPVRLANGPGCETYQARNPGLAHPAFWALVGAVIAAAAAIVLDFPPDTPIGFALIATGTICATIVRYGTRWSDDSAPLTPHAINACAAK